MYEDTGLGMSTLTAGLLSQILSNHSSQWKVKVKLMYSILFVKLTSQTLFHLSFIIRIPEPQKPQMKPPEDIVRSNHYDPEEDEEYYRKQLSYFDRRSFESKPSAHVPASHLSEPAKPVHSQSQPQFSSYSSK